MGKKIVMIAGWFYPYTIGGTEKYVHLLAKEMLQLGYDVTVAAPSLNEKEQQYLWDGVSVYRYPIDVRATKREWWEYDPPRYFPVFQKWLCEMKPDLVHVHSKIKDLGFYHCKYIKELGIPLIRTVHLPGNLCFRGTMMRFGRIPCDGKIMPYRCSVCYLQNKGMPIFAASLLSAMPQIFRDRAMVLRNRLATALQTRRIITEKRDRVLMEFHELVDHYVLLADWMVKVFLLNGVSSEKVTLIRHGLPKAYFRRRNPSEILQKKEPTRIGFLGRFDPLKGIHVLIKAFRALPAQVPCELYIYGRPISEEEIRYYRDLQVLARPDRRIVFGGEINETNRREIFEGMDVMAVPSQWFETGPLVILEAFSAGIPVIGSSIGGIAEHVQDGVNGRLIPPLDLGAWKSVIRQIALDRNLVHGWQKGIGPVNPLDNLAQEMRQIYEKHLSR